MTGTTHAVAIAEAIVSNEAGDTLVAYGLGSCVAVCCYDPIQRIAGMLHALLPYSVGSRAAASPAKFVDTGIAQLLEALTAAGARRQRLLVSLVGGAQMLTGPAFTGTNNGVVQIGQRNIEAALETLESLGLRVYAQAVGGTQGRTVRLAVSTGQISVKTVTQDERVLVAAQRIA